MSIYTYTFVHTDTCVKYDINTMNMKRKINRNKETP